MKDIIVVSGLPRSGTSLMMNMLSVGGIPVFIDGKRLSDDSNPNGYFEFDKVKYLKNDASWIPQVRGKAIKIISNLLEYLPENERYKIIFIERDINEIIASQESMLKRFGKSQVNNAELKKSFIKHLNYIKPYLDNGPNIDVTYLNYRRIIDNPEYAVNNIFYFLGIHHINKKLMEQVVDPSLYREKI